MNLLQITFIELRKLPSIVLAKSCFIPWMDEFYWFCFYSFLFLCLMKGSIRRKCNELLRAERKKKMNPTYVIFSDNMFQKQDWKQYILRWTNTERISWTEMRYRNSKRYSSSQEQMITDGKLYYKKQWRAQVNAKENVPLFFDL